MSQYNLNPVMKKGVYGIDWEPFARQVLTDACGGLNYAKAKKDGLLNQLPAWLLGIVDIIHEIKPNWRAVYMVLDAAHEKGLLDELPQYMTNGMNVIGWCDITHSWHGGCQKIQIECKLCYSEAMDKRFPIKKGEEAKRFTWWNNGERKRHYTFKDNVTKYDKWARKLGIIFYVFANSSSDLFEDKKHVPDEWRDDAMRDIMTTTNCHFMLLTKRIQNAADYLAGQPDEVLNKIMIGATIGHEKSLHNLPVLNGIPAQSRFISAEPLLTKIDYQFDKYRNIDFVITGEESGHGNRYTDPRWTRDIKNQCLVHGVHYYHKQNTTGAKGVYAGKLLDGKEYCDLPRLEVAA